MYPAKAEEYISMYKSSQSLAEEVKDLGQQLEIYNNADAFYLLGLSDLEDTEVIKRIIQSVVRMGLYNEALTKDERNFCDSKRDGNSQCWYFEKFGYGPGESTDCARHAASYLIKYGHDGKWWNQMTPGKSQAMYEAEARRIISKFKE